VSFEPSNLGDIKGTLTISSPIGGDYVFPLNGTSLPPKPQGPFTIKANSNTTISFKNVFSSQLSFTFSIDNPLFFLTKSSETIRSHQTSKIIVGFNGNNNANKAEVMAKLIITPPKIQGFASNVQWIYYLKGVTS
jgi:hydrocephalus-inducing protein